MTRTRTLLPAAALAATALLGGCSADVDEGGVDVEASNPVDVPTVEGEVEGGEGGEGGEEGED